MALEFDRILPCIGVGGSKERCNDLVDHSLAIANRAEMSRMASGLGHRMATPEEAVGNLHGSFSGETDDRQGASRGGRRSNNRIVVDIHAISVRCAGVAPHGYELHS